MSHRRRRQHIPSTGCHWQLAGQCRTRAPSTDRLRPVLLVLSALWIATSGCTSPQRQAREESAQRWNQVRAQVKAKLASDRLAAGHVEDAATELAEAFRLDPTNPELLTLQGRVHLARGDHYAAEHLLESIEVQGPQRAEIDYLLGTIQQQRLHWEEAYDHFIRAASEDPHEIAYLVAIVQNLLQLDEAEEALAFLRSYEDQFGWTGAYHAALAECFEQLGDWSAAAVAWEKVVDASDVPSVRERLAIALYRCQRWPEAIAHLQRLLDEADAQPPDPLRLMLARCLLEKGRPAQAHQQITQVLRDDPQNAPALQLLARAFAQQGQIERARRIAEQALLLEPDSLHALELAAALAFRTGNQARASTLAQRVAQSFPDRDSPVARHILGQLPASSSAEE